MILGEAAHRCRRPQPQKRRRNRLRRVHRIRGLCRQLHPDLQGVAGRPMPVHGRRIPPTIQGPTRSSRGAYGDRGVGGRPASASVIVAFCSRCFCTWRLGELRSDVVELLAPVQTKISVPVPSTCWSENTFLQGMPGDHTTVWEYSGLWLCEIIQIQLSTITVSVTGWQIVSH